VTDALKKKNRRKEHMKSHDAHNHSHCHHKKTEIRGSQNHKDPVCGMLVDPKTAKGQSDFEGKTYYFCSAKCKSRFDENPLEYLTEKKSLAPVSLGAEYTCPMHPQIRQIGPGDCPICGMSLEPVDPTSASEDDSEYKMMLRKFFVSAALSLPLVFLTMGGRHLFPIDDSRLFSWAELILATPVVLWGGWPFFHRFWQSLRHRSLNMFTLIGLGVGVAYAYSLVAVLFPGLFPSSLVDPMTDTIALYF
jgi:Cu+-exporting ATPase